MLLEYELVKGIKRNAVIDVKLSCIHLVTSRYNSIDTIIDELTEYNTSDCVHISRPSQQLSFVELLEVKYSSSFIESVFNLSMSLFSEFLIIHVQDNHSFKELIDRIMFYKSNGNFILHQIIIVVDFVVEPPLTSYTENKSGFIKIIHIHELNASRIIKPSNFVVDRDSILHHNSRNLFYFSRLCICSDGYLKPYFESNVISAHISKIKTFNCIKKNNNLTELWYISKNQISVCKDCEFRAICFDTILPVKNKEQNYYRPVECNYNPYIAKWQGEEGYRTLAECGVISNENGFSIDHEKIAEINKELWGEE